MLAIQLLVPSGGRRKSSIDVTVVVELASRIQDLVQNESGELLAHGVDPISREHSSPIWDIYHLGKKH